MTPVFADTYFFLALINPRDAAHPSAVAAANSRRGPLLTTAWVLTEVADGLARTPDRHLVAKIVADLDQEPRDIVVPASQDLFDRGLRLYLARSRQTLVPHRLHLLRRDGGVPSPRSAHGRSPL